MTLFYERLLESCDKRNETPSFVAEKCGMNQSTASRWRNGSVPRGNTLRTLAKYFDCDISWLAGEKGKDDRKLQETEQKPLGKVQGEDVDEEELNEYLEILKNSPDHRMLFHTTKGATREQIMEIVYDFERKKYERGDR